VAAAPVFFFQGIRKVIHDESPARFAQFGVTS
jgi:hypothetical protein